MAQNITTQRGSRIDGRTVSRAGYAISQRVRKRIEEIFGWLKAIASGRKLRYRGVRRNQLWADMATAAFNLVLGNLLAEAPWLSAKLIDPVDLGEQSPAEQRSGPPLAARRGL